MGAVEIKGYCTLCRSRCGTINRVENDQLIAVRPDPEHPNGSAMCLKGRAAPELVHSPHRVLYPMKRTRPKTDADPGWIRISWDEALDTVAERLSDIRAVDGAEAVAFSVTTPSGTPLSDSIDWIERFLRCFGSPNMAYAVEICNWHKDNAHAFTFGSAMPVADYAAADTIVLWGHNPANTWLSQASAIARGRARGARMVVIDPRPTALAREADVWLPVRPGTDAALALGIVRHLIDNGLYDTAFVRRWTNAPYLVRRDNGLLLREQDIEPTSPTNRLLVWDTRAHCTVPVDTDRAMPDALVDALQLDGECLPVAARGATIPCDTVFARLYAEAARYTPAEVERITGVEPAQVAAAAELMRGGRRMAYHAWTGVGQHSNATQTERAIATVYALNGSFDAIGGNRQRTAPPLNPLVPPDLLPPVQRAKVLGLAERPIGPPTGGWVTALDLYRAILDGEPYRVRALMSFGTNIAVSHADTALAIRALEQLEFHVHLDLFETPSSRYADILLPVNTPWEREGLRVGFEISDEAASLAQLRPRMVTPRGESRADYEIVLDLAQRLGMGDRFFGGDLYRGWNHLLAPSGIDVEALRKQPGGIHLAIDARERKYALPAVGQPADSVRGFGTPSRRVELYCETFLRHGQPPLPHHVAPAEGQRQDQSGAARFPLILSTAKNGYFCHSQHRSLVSLRKKAPDPGIELAPALAQRQGIGEGDWVRVTTRIGTARFVARLMPGLAEDVVVAEFGWWQACSELGKDASAPMGVGSSNFNSLVSAEDHDPISGSVAMRSFRCSIEPDPETDARQRRWAGYAPFEVRRVEHEAEGVIAIELARPDGGSLPDYLPGQHLQIRLPVDGAPLGRAYSLTGSAMAADRRSYTIAVRHQRGRLPGGDSFEGRMSSHLHRALQPGQVVEVQAPSGSFLIPSRSLQPLVFLAGGIGITPFMSQLESMANGDLTEIWLYYGNQNSQTHAFRARLAEHARRLPGLHVVNHYAAPLVDDLQGRDYDSRDFITAALVSDDLIARRARVYMCGPPPMMDAFAKGLTARGLPAFDIFREVFRSPPGPLLDDGRSYAVQFRSTGKGPLRWTADQGPLLAFAERQGLQLPNGCRVGQCESCAVRIVSGKVRHLNGTEPEDDGTCLLCQAVPMEDLLLDA